MISSFASVLVANANATPENVVPWRKEVSESSSTGCVMNFVQNQCQQLVALSIFHLHLLLPVEYTDSCYAVRQQLADAVHILRIQGAVVEALQDLRREIAELCRLVVGGAEVVFGQVA
jgi:hypothetical protein